MKDLSAIPIVELETGLADSIEDIRLCAIALRAGMRAHNDGLTVLDRIRGNCDIIARIETELFNRRVAPPPPGVLMPATYPVTDYELRPADAMEGRTCTK